MHRQSASLLPFLSHLSVCPVLDFAPSLPWTALGRACEEGPLLRPAQVPNVIIAELEGTGHVKRNPSKSMF